MAHQTVTTFTDGDIPVLLEQDEKNGQRFRVTYGAQVRSGLSYAQAAKEYGECVFHSLACAGKLDQPE
jgi:hypothetical protein